METLFESKRIKFVKITEELLDDYLKMVNDLDNVGRLIGRSEPVSKEKELKWIRKKSEENAQIYSMIEKETNEFIGNIEFMDIIDNKTELGIAITKEKQDKGFGTEAIKKTIDYGHNTLGLKRIFLKVYPTNLRAIHVYKKCGFLEYQRTEQDIYMELPSKN